MRTFMLNDVEEAKANEFKHVKHAECAKTYVGVSGGHFSYIFVPDSLGTHCMIQCAVCEEEENITDYKHYG